MVYKVIGLMSGSSLDGLDICYAQFEESRGHWSAEMLHTACVPYSQEWIAQLRQAQQLSVPDFLKLHTAYGRYVAQLVQSFIDEHALEHKVHFVATHGHTVFHEPAAHTTFQLGDGATMAALLGLPVISDLRAMDVALGGQAAPIVPIGDRLLFGNFDILINIGGIANMSLHQGNQQYIAFDVCVANQALNALAQQMGHDYDAFGAIAASGNLLPAVLAQLSAHPFYTIAAPKSLSNAQAMHLVQALIADEQYSVPDKLHTICHLIVAQIAAAIPAASEERKAFVTGGGAFNSYLMQLLQTQLAQQQIELVIPDEKIIAFKEALVMGLIGTLRWREEVNVLAAVTGAQRDSVSGALWMGQI